jgi:membrane fusion protein (multidrug efflux system)
MAKRMGLMLLVVGLFIAGIGTYKFMQIQAAIKAGASRTMPPATVTTAIAKEEEWPATRTAIGTVVAVNGVMVSADLGGVVREIAFESGRRVTKGQVLVRLETSTERAQLAQAQASWDLAKLNLERAEKLIERGVIAQSELDRYRAEARQAEASVDAIRAIIDRKTIVAPFSGVLGIRQANLGQRLSEGDPIVELQSLDPVYVNFSLPQGDVNALEVGAQVRVTSDADVTTQTGRITSINSVIDPSTRNVQVQATFANRGEALRPGMFVDVLVDLGSPSTAITLPTTAIAYAPYGNSVYVVEELKDPAGKPYKGVNQRFVKTGRERGDQVAVLSGLKVGDEVVSTGAFKLRPAMAVVVDNKVLPGNDPAPKPEDN